MWYIFHAVWLLVLFPQMTFWTIFKHLSILSDVDILTDLWQSLRVLQFKFCMWPTVWVSMIQTRHTLSDQQFDLCTGSTSLMNDLDALVSKWTESTNVQSILEIAFTIPFWDLPSPVEPPCIITLTHWIFDWILSIRRCTCLVSFTLFYHISPRQWIQLWEAFICGLFIFVWHE